MKFTPATAVSLLVLVSCTELVPQAKPAQPTVTILRPASDTSVPFNTAFHLSAAARAPEGTLSQAHIVLRGAVSSLRTIPLSGATKDIEVDLIVPQDALLGPDHIPLDILILVEANVNGRTVVGAPTGLTVTMVDRSAPIVEFYSPEALPPDAGFDLQVPGGRPFTLQVRAEDAVGGITELGIDAPATLGGLRTHQQPASRAARFEVVLAPPAHGDFEVEVYAVDTAQTPNRATRTVRIRVGRGGTDDVPPQVRITAPPTLECGYAGTATVTATDLASGIERVQVGLDGASETTFASADDIQSAVTVPLALSGAGPADRVLQISATARDFFGRFSATATAAVRVVDTVGPALSATFGRTLTPGSTATLTVDAQELCGGLQAARLTLLDATGTATSVQTQIQGARYAGPIAFEIPTNLCVSSSIEASLVVLDDLGNPSSIMQSVLPAQDVIAPKIAVSVLAPSGGLSPGQSAPLQVDLVDFGSAIRSSTVTVTLVGTSTRAPLLVRSARWPDGGCGGTRVQSLSLQVTLPPDLRLTAQARIQIDVRAEDHAGQVGTRTLQVPIVDQVAPQVQFRDLALTLVQGSTQSVAVSVFDLHSDVSQVTLRVSGPATINGQSEWTEAVQAPSATVNFVIATDAGAALGATVAFQAIAFDAATPPNSATATLQYSTCGPPQVSAVSPSLGPIGGGNEVTVYGQGFAPGLVINLARERLENVQILSSSAAVGRVPRIGQSAGLVDVTVVNSCGMQRPEGRLLAGYRFVALPIVRRVRPSNLAGLEPGASVFVVAGAVADGVRLTEVGAEMAGVSVVQPASSTRETLDAILLAPTTTTAVDLLVWAVDEFGQRSEVQHTLPVDGAQSLGVQIHHPGPVGLGETSSFQAISRGRDDRLRNVTLSAIVTSNRPDLLSVSGPGMLQGIAVGTATVQVQFDGQQSSLRIDVVDDALVTELRPLLLSPLVPPGLAGVAPASFKVQHVINGTRSDVSTQVTISVQPSGLAQVSGRQITATSTGTGVIDISWAGRSVQRPLWVMTRLDVSADASVVVPSGQHFEGGQIDGLVRGTGASDWTLSVASGGRLAVAAGGELILAGTPSAPGPGGQAGSAPGQAPCNVACGLSSSGVFAGGGGGSIGMGGDGGGLTTSGGQSSSQIGGGGAGASSSGGGGGGIARFQMAGAELVLDGTVDLCGGPGGSAPTVSGLGGGGAGAGGIALIDVQNLQGQGLIRVCGGSGGAGSWSGGGGGAGTVQIRAAQAPTPFLDIDRAGGLSGPASAPNQSGEDGQAGTTNR